MLGMKVLQEPIYTSKKLKQKITPTNNIMNEQCFLLLTQCNIIGENEII